MVHIAAVRTAALAIAAYVAIAGAASETLVHADGHCLKGSVEVDRDQRRLVVALDNRCEARIPCKVTWRLRCGHGQYQDREAQVSIAARSDERVEASASSCDGDSDWELSPPRWRCDEPVDVSAAPHGGKRGRRR